MTALPLFNMFGRSPVQPLKHHMEKVLDATENLSPFFEAVFESDWSAAGKLRSRISTLEGEADATKRELRLSLPRGLFLPVERSDILEVLAIQDRIANRAKDIAGIVFGRRMEIPCEIIDVFRSFMQCCIDATRQAHHTIMELESLCESGFKGNEVKVVEKMIVEIDRIEHDSDEWQIQVRQKLFPIESSISPINLMFLYRVVDWLGDLADYAQSVGGQLHLMIAR